MLETFGDSAAYDTLLRLYTMGCTERRCAVSIKAWSKERNARTIYGETVMLKQFRSNRRNSGPREQMTSCS